MSTADTSLNASEPDVPKGDLAGLDQFGYIGLYPHRPLLKFDLSSIPDGATVLQAELTLELITTYGGGTASLLVWLPNDDWAEETATWNSYDQSGAIYLGSLPSAEETGPRTWSINMADWNYAADLFDNAVTFRTRWEAEGNGSYKWNVYSSKEGGVSPKLTLTIAAPQILGDLNCDGAVDFGDINPFVALMTQCGTGCSCPGPANCP